ncbi:MAG: hypothetical protein HKM89_00480 [Gemmatimonadales bacterium]|nr:hypothetical protein [Gemmatimonadales bacterium]
MAKATSEDGSTIEELLQQRAKFEDWIAKLDESQKLASEAVRERVRKDYEKRLAAVVDELRGHSDAVADQLAELRNTQSDLTSKQDASEEALAEAELRHAVGEYTEDEWDKLSAESSDALDEVRQQLDQVNGEIDRLAEVQALIAAPVAAPPKGKRPGRKAPVYNSESWVPDAEQAAGQRETLTPPAPLDAAEAEADAGRRRVSAPKFVPRGKGKPGGKPKTLRFPTGGAAAAASGAEVDELDFLKSVSEDAVRGPSPERASGGHERPEAESEEVDEAQTKGQKTLKCAECGGLNLPTEWYCENCGAELASL